MAFIATSGLLLLTMGIARRFGGWGSASDAWAWLTAEPQWLYPILGAPIIIVALSVVSAAATPYNHVIAYAIEAFFLAYAFIAAGRAFWGAGITSIASWFRN